MRKGDAALAVGLGLALGLVEALRRAKQADDVWNQISRSMQLTAALGVETAHLLTDGEVPADVQKTIYGEVVY